MSLVLNFLQLLIDYGAQAARSAEKCNASCAEVQCKLKYNPTQSSWRLAARSENAMQLPDLNL